MVGGVLGPVVFVLLWVLPLGAPSVEVQRLLAIVGLVGIWWMSEALPLAATALLGPALCVVAGIAPARDVLRPFADPVIFLFLGGFLLAEAMVKHGLNRRIALGILSRPALGGSALGVLTGFGVLTALISAWVSNTATAAMVLPIAISVLREVAAHDSGEADAWRSQRMAAPLILVVAFGASVGGLATPLGTPPNLIGIGLIESTLGRRIGFFEWMKVGLPAAVFLTAALVWRLHRVGGCGGVGGSAWSLGRAWVMAEVKRIGAWTTPERQVAMVFAAAIGLWVYPGLLGLVLGTSSPTVRWWQAHFPEGIVALLAAVSLFALPSRQAEGGRVLTWPDVARVDWGSILLFGGGMALGELMFSTGLAKWMGEGVASFLPWKSTLSITVLFVVAGLAVSEATSNTASATMMIPLSIAVAQGAGVEPLQPALGACLGCSLGFMLPVSTPPNALAYGTGAVPLLQMIRHGFWLDAVGAAVVVVCVLLFAP